MGYSARICPSNELPDDAKGLGMQVENHCSRGKSSLVTGEMTHDDTTTTPVAKTYQAVIISQTLC